MTNEQLAYLQTLPVAQRGQIAMQYSTKEKKTSTAILLALFLGGLGIHHFYLERTWEGVLSVLFFWTFIPGLIAFVELFFLSGVVARMNHKQFTEICTLFSATSGAA